MGFAVTAAQAGQKLCGVRRAGNFRVGFAGTAQRMRIAAADHRFIEAGGELHGELIRARQDLAVDAFDAMKIARENGKVVFGPLARKAGIDVVDGDKQPAFARVSKQAFHVRAAALQLDVIFFGDSIHARVHFGAAGHGCR